MSSTRRLLFVGADGAPFARVRADIEARKLPVEIMSALDWPSALAQLPRLKPDAVLARGGSTGDRWSFFRDVRKALPTTVCLTVDDNDAPTSLASMVIRVPKTADAAVIMQQIDRGRALSSITDNDTVRRIAGDLQTLPTVPRTYQSLTDVLSRPDSSVADVAKIVQSDPALSLQVLHLVNSAYFGLSRRTTSIADAVAFLGVDQLKGLVLASHIFSAIDNMPTRFFSLEAFQANAVKVARLAKSFMADRTLAEAAFTAGILLDVGKIVLGMREPERFEKALDRVLQTHERDFVVEREIIGASHTEIGAFLLATWQIPFSIVECVALHHEPDKYTAGGSPLLAAVHAADALIGIIGCGDPEETLNLEFLKRSGVAGQLPEWRRLAEATCGAEP